MDAHRIEPASLDAVVEFITAWSPEALEIAGTPAGSPEIAEARRSHRLDELNVAEAEQLATRLHRVFLGATPPKRREALNDLIARLSPCPATGAGGHEWRVSDGSQVETARLVMALWDHAGADPELERLGTCAWDRCIDAFHDSTQAHTRKFCSLTCQNRAKVAAYRSRQRAR